MGQKTTATVGFSSQRLSYARTVLREAPDLINGVIGGNAKRIRLVRLSFKLTDVG
jgi:hypothetical protein